MDYYSDIVLSRKNAQIVAFAIIADIEDYCATHAEEFQAYLKSEEEKERGDSIQNKSVNRKSYHKIT